LWFQKYGPDSFSGGWIGLFKPNSDNLSDYITYEYVKTRSGALKFDTSYLKKSFDLKLVVNNIVFYKAPTHIGEEKEEKKDEKTSVDKKVDDKKVDDKKVDDKKVDDKKVDDKKVDDKKPDEKKKMKK